MSAQFILQYGGCPVRIENSTAKLVPEAEADRYCSEADAWIAAHHASLHPDRCQVIDLYQRNQNPVKS